MPHTTTDLQEHAEEYAAIKDALALVFEWLFITVSHFYTQKRIS
jgi:hypothetical protein